MIERPPEYEKIVARNAERQMRRWAMRLERQQLVESAQALAELPEQIFPYIAISRTTGVGGSEIAHRVGAILGWDVLAKELLNYIADKFKLPRIGLESVDETRSSWIVEVFGKWLDSRLVTQSEYVSLLGKAVLLAAHHSHAVFVGRGAQFFLPRERGLAVQLIAPLEQRVERIMKEQQMTESAARHDIETRDQGRCQFVHTYFHRDSTSSYLYDLVINLGLLTSDDAVDLIVRTAARRFNLPVAT